MIKFRNPNVRRLLPEWVEQSGILIAWPHKGTDWSYMLDEVQKCYLEIAESIAEVENLIIVTPDVDAVKSVLPSHANIRYFKIKTNDTWARDFGPIAIMEEGSVKLCDFGFNAWGNKFNWELDNNVTQELCRKNAFLADILDCRNFILEGGSIETDGNGLLLTTSNCLLTTTRNPQLSKTEIEGFLCETFGLNKILWLEHGYLEGDDTDCHIDTIARLAPDSGIVYEFCDNPADAHFGEFQKMKLQLESFTDCKGNPFKLFQLPFPDPILDEDGNRLPATYANYLIINGRVLVPVYGQQNNDAKALEVIKSAFPNHEVRGIDCNALIKQHGSLHCVTMQLPSNVLNK